MMPYSATTAISVATAANDLAHRARIAGGPHFQIAVARDRLIHRPIDVVPHRLVESPVPHVGGDADDRPALRVDREHTADRIHAGKELFAHEVVDHRDSLRIRFIARLDAASTQDANAHGAEIARRHTLVVGRELAPVRRREPAGDLKPGAPPVVAERGGAR